MKVMRSPACWKPGQQKQTRQKALIAVSDSRSPPVYVGGPHPYGWKDKWLKILIPLQSLVSCFLEPPMNRQAAVGATEGLWQGLLPSVC